MSKLCHCGQPLHYTDPAAKAWIEEMVAKHGEYVRVIMNDRTWLVQRHYIALHGIKAWELPTLGFLEIES
jgi:hypothetical protein